jgi:iron-sulfur cluster repair protein YtfE (RIC family)
MSPTERLVALGQELLRVHHELRDELASVRAAVAAAEPVDSAARQTLAAHCTAFCTALATHHRDEDGGVFPLLANEVPELRGVIASLTEDHSLIASTLQQLRTLAQSIRPDASPGELRHLAEQVDGLAAVMESHFSWEERRIVRSLDELGAQPEGFARLMGLAPPTPTGRHREG